jgi:hypothetical protein
VAVLAGFAPPTGLDHLRRGADPRVRWLACRRDKQRAVVAAGNSLIVITWHPPSDPKARFTHLGPGWHNDWLAYFDRANRPIAELDRFCGKRILLQESRLTARTRLR